MIFSPLPLIDSTVVDVKDCEALRQDPRFRRASLNMLLAFKALENLVTPWKNILQGEAGVVLATSHGELETSKEFLKTYAQQGAARPILFQNSLHNSTLSFVTQTLGFDGLSLTTSNSFLSGEKALETAALLLNQKVVQVCFVLGVDTVVPDLKSIYEALVPPSFQLGEGCGGVMLASLDWVQKTKAPVMGTLKEINYFPSSGQDNTVANYYDSDALAHLARGVKNRSGEIRLSKPNGSVSVIHWEGAPA